MKPNDFQIGVLDFFAILLPGGLATWLVTRYLAPEDLSRLLIFGTAHGTPDTLTLAGAFLLSSYVLGHFVFMLGAQLDPAYDAWRKRTKPTSRDATFQAANDLRMRATASLADSEFSTLKWAKAYIQVNAQHARSEIDRFEADSKFFRSLVVVAVAIALHLLRVERMPYLAGCCLILAVLAYRRFVDQRWKMTELCYCTAVIVDAMQPPGTAPTSANHEEE